MGGRVLLRDQGCVSAALLSALDTEWGDVLSFLLVDFIGEIIT